MKTLLLSALTLLVCVTTWALDPCCKIKGIDLRTGIITAANNQTGATFGFSAPLALARNMKVGQAVYADFKTGAVTVQGVTQHFSISPSPLMAGSPAVRILTQPGQPGLQLVITPSRFTSYCGHASGEVRLPAPLVQGLHVRPSVTIKLTANSQAAVIPATVTIPAGASFVDFPVSGMIVQANIPVLITATEPNGQQATAKIEVLAPEPVLITISPFSVNGVPPPFMMPGSKALESNYTGIVDFDCASDNSFRVVSQNPAVVTLGSGSSEAKIRGSAQSTFEIFTNFVPTETTIQLSVIGPSVTKTITAAVPVGITSVAVNPVTTAAGSSAFTGKITLSGPAPAAGALVKFLFESTHGGSCHALPVAGPVTVPAGATSASFTIGTSPSAADDFKLFTYYYNVQKTYWTSIHTLDPSLAAIEVPASITGGQSASGKIRLNSALPPTGCTNLTFSLTSSNPNIQVVPASLTVVGVAEGSFAIQSNAIRGPDQTATITATGISNGTPVSRQATITVKH